MTLWPDAWRLELPGPQTNLEVQKAGDGFLIEKEIEFTAGETEDDIFSVTGLVALRVIGVITENIAATVDNASVGTSNSATAIIANTTGDNLNGEVGAIWVDNAPQTNGEIKEDAFSANMYVVHDEDIVATSTANHDAGKVKFYCFWKPISSDGKVEPA